MNYESYPNESRETTFNYVDWGKKVRGQFDKMRTYSESYEAGVLGKQITVLPEVFSPEYFTDSASLVSL